MKNQVIAKITILLLLLSLWWSGSLLTFSSVDYWAAYSAIVSWVIVMACNKLWIGRACALVIIIEAACLMFIAAYAYLPVNLSDTIYELIPLTMRCAIIMQVILILASIGGRAFGATDRVGQTNTNRDPNCDNNNPFSLSGGEAVAQ